LSSAGSDSASIGDIVAVAVGVRVGIGDGVIVGVRVDVGVLVGVLVGVGVGVVVLTLTMAFSPITISISCEDVATPAAAVIRKFPERASRR
jgi:hypothetical protein